MFIHMISGLILLYLFFRLVFPLRLSRGVKVCLAAVLLLVTQQHLLNRYVFGGMASPELPPAMLMLQGWSFVTVLFLLVLTLARDAALLLVRLARRGKPRPRSGFSPERRQALICLAACLPAAYGVSRAVDVPGVHRMERRLRRLPRELDGLNIVQISDLHVSALLSKGWVREVVGRVNALQPDLILFTGDTVDGPPARRARGVAPLRDLRARHGILACVGNHEYYGDFQSWMRAFPDLGIRVLQNSHALVPVRGAELVIGGVTDVAAARFGLPMPDCAAAFAGAPEDRLRILLDHRPGKALENAGQGVDLQLSGHTHGGHMIGMRSLVARFNSGYVYGWYSVGGMDMYVSSGAGLWNGFPVRLGVPSEIAQIILRSA